MKDEDRVACTLAAFSFVVMRPRMVSQYKNKDLDLSTDGKPTFAGRLLDGGYGSGFMQLHRRGTVRDRPQQWSETGHSSSVIVFDLQMLGTITL